MKKEFGRGFGFGGGGSAAGGGELANEIITTVAYLPGIPLATDYPAGTVIETILTDLLAPYVKPRTSGLSTTLSPNDTYIEVGRSVGVVSAAWSIVNGSDGNPPANMYITGDGFNKTVTGTSSTANPASTTQRLTAGVNSWQLSAEDKDSVPLAGLNYTRSWVFRYWLGATNAADPIGDVTATALALALQQSQLLISKTASFTCTANNDTAGNYTWIAYPASYGALASITQDGALPVLSAFTYVGAFNITNAYGIIESYRFYKSNADKAFAIGAVLTIL